MGILRIFHAQQFLFETDEFNILLAVFPKLLTMMNQISLSPKQWFPESVRGRSYLMQIEQSEAFGRFGLKPETFEEFLHALQICHLETFDIPPFTGLQRFVVWSSEVQRRSLLFRLENFQGERYRTTFQMPVPKLESLTSSHNVNTV